VTTPDHPDLTDCLFHYTSTKGLIGILEERCVWATDASFLNDSSEIRYAGRALQNHLESMIAELRLGNPAPGSIEAERLIRITDAKEANVKFNEQEDAPPPLPPYVKDGATYVSCFSEQPDQLSQWRAYGGRGYAVGFTREGLGNLEIDGEDEPFKPAGQVAQVGYGQPAIDDLCQKVANYFARPDFLSLPRPSGLLDTVSFVLPALARVKHEAFKDELEWRVTVSRYARGPAKKLYFREGVRLVPYLKLRFDPSAVAWVFIGPGADIHDERALRGFLEANGYDLDRAWVERSNAPFRDS